MIKSSLNHLLGEYSPPRSSRNFSAYQGPQLPIPTLSNNVVFAQNHDKVQCKPVFNLGFVADFEDDSQPPSAPSCGVQATSLPSLHKILGPTKPVSQYNIPREDSQMKSLGHKKFSVETQKKISWVTNMYHQWRVDRNKNPELVQHVPSVEGQQKQESRTGSYLC